MQFVFYLGRVCINAIIVIQTHLCYQLCILGNHEQSIRNDEVADTSIQKKVFESLQKLSFVPGCKNIRKSKKKQCNPEKESTQQNGYSEGTQVNAYPPRAASAPRSIIFQDASSASDS